MAMALVYRFMSTYEVLIYILLAIGGLFALRGLWQSWNEWREALYSLEKEFALRRLGQATAMLTLITFLFCGEFIMASFVIPSLPASYFLATPTLDLLATPTGTLSPELATQLGLASPSGTRNGCVPGQVIITSPKAGSEVKGRIEIRGTASIPNFGFYKYEVAPLHADTWTTIAAGRDAKVEGLLGEWDTTALPPGDYQLRLVVVDNRGEALPPCSLPVRVIPPS